MNANANAPINAFFGPAFHDHEPMLYDPYEKMLLIAATEPEESRNTCTRWWIEDLIAAQIRAEERGRVCGEDAQVVEPYVAWLSDEQLREIDELEACCQTKAHAEPRDVHGPDSEPERHTTSASVSSSSSSTSSTSTSPSSSAPTSQTDASQMREKGRTDGMADAWLFQAERAMDVWSEVLGVMIDHAHGISQEERAQRCEPYADWTLGPPPPFTDYGAVFC